MSLEQVSSIHFGILTFFYPTYRTSCPFGARFTHCGSACQSKFSIRTRSLETFLLRKTSFFLEFRGTPSRGSSNPRSSLTKLKPRSVKSPTNLRQILPRIMTKRHICLYRDTPKTYARAQLWQFSDPKSEHNELSKSRLFFDFLEKSTSSRKCKQ